MSWFPERPYNDLPLYMLNAVAETSKWTIEKIQAIRQLFHATREHVRIALPKIYSRELVDIIFEQPYCRIGNLTGQNIAKRETASRYLKELVAKGVLSERSHGREKLFVNVRLMNLLVGDDNTLAAFG